MFKNFVIFSPPLQVSYLGFLKNLFNFFIKLIFLLHKK